MATTNERLDHGFAVFNLHINNAGERADAEFIAQYGKKIWKRHIEPSHDEGIMTILQKPANRYRSAWITLVTAYVNEPTEVATAKQMAEEFLAATEQAAADLQDALDAVERAKEDA